MCIQNSGYFSLNIFPSTMHVKIHVWKFALALSSAKVCMHKASVCNMCSLRHDRSWMNKWNVICLGSHGILNESYKGLFPAQTNEKRRWICWKISSSCYWKIHAKNEYFISLKSHSWLADIDCLSVVK